MNLRKGVRLAWFLACLALLAPPTPAQQYSAKPVRPGWLHGAAHHLGLHVQSQPVQGSRLRSVRYFAPVTVVGNSATIVARHPSLPLNSMRDIEQLARTSPVDYATPGIGLAGHLSGELFKTLAKIDMQAIPFTGAGPAIAALLSGQVKLGFVAMPSTVPHIKAGRLVAIAVTSLQRLAALPEVPTVAESGYPGFQVDNMYGVLVPAGTPAGVVRKLHADIAQVLQQPEVRAVLAAAAIDVIGNTPEEFARYIQDEYAKWARLLKVSGTQVL